jgi:hypothetical protein
MYTKKEREHMPPLLWIWYGLLLVVLYRDEEAKDLTLREPFRMPYLPPFTGHVRCVYLTMTWRTWLSV